MAQPTNPADPGEYLSALATILIVGTTVAAGSVVIEKGLDTETVQMPALILNCPHVHRMRKSIGGPGASVRQATFEIHGMYLDRWEVTSRTLEQALGDCRDALSAMALNVEADPMLGFDAMPGMDDCQVRVDGPVSDPGLGFPLITGELVLRVVGPVYVA